MIQLDAKQLVVELNALCRQLFGFIPDADLVERYQKANAVVFSKTTALDYTRQNHRLIQALAKKRDLEALEYAWRFTNSKNILTRKMHLFMFLIETDPSYYARFVSHKQKRVTAYISLGMLGVRSAWKLFKGIVNVVSLKEASV
jgi:hypothetical protein